MAYNETAHSFDCDGVIVHRIPIQMDALKCKRGFQVLPSTLPIVSRVVDETPLSIWDGPSYVSHLVRGVPREARDAVLSIKSRGVFLNTGRENRRDYVDLTDNVLKRAGIRDRFLDLFFGNKGLSTVVSKIVHLTTLSEFYDQVYHYDDNPRTSLTIERYFRERGRGGIVKSVLVKDWSSGFLMWGVKPEDHPNLIVAKNIQEAVKLATY